jgi:Sulfotransferase domain
MIAIDSSETAFITVVSGLPRSGTSMMMRMLEAGGVPAITDNIRAADHDNPLGYYEFEPVKQLSKDASWLATSSNKVVKIIYRLLYDLPRYHSYKVIFMRRELEEILASQQAMLRRQNKVGGALSDYQLANAFGSDLLTLDAWISGQDNFKILHVNYNDVLYDSKPTVTEIAQFLGYKLDTEAMIKVIDRSLHRQRVGDYSDNRVGRCSRARQMPRSIR